MQSLIEGVRGRWKTVWAVVGVALLALFVAASPAAAHVKVDGTAASQGGYGVLTFRVPTESSTASTTRLRVTFPKDTPIASVSVQPHAGWTAKVHTKKLKTPVKTEDGKIDSYVARVDWKAKSSHEAIKPGEFDMFRVSAGPLPKKSSITVPALQYYSNGKKVNWNQQSAARGAEPEHPAPKLKLAPAGDSSPPSSGQPGSHSGGDRADTGNSASGAGWMNVAGLVAGLLGLIAGIIAIGRTRRSPSPETDQTVS